MWTSSPCLIPYHADKHHDIEWQQWHDCHEAPININQHWYNANIIYFAIHYLIPVFRYVSNIAYLVWIMDTVFNKSVYIFTSGTQAWLNALQNSLPAEIHASEKKSTFYQYFISSLLDSPFFLKSYIIIPYTWLLWTRSKTVYSVHNLTKIYKNRHCWIIVIIRYIILMIKSHQFKFFSKH